MECVVWSSEDWHSCCCCRCSGWNRYRSWGCNEQRRRSWQESARRCRGRDQWNIPEPCSFSWSCSLPNPVSKPDSDSVSVGDAFAVAVRDPRRASHHPTVHRNIKSKHTSGWSRRKLRFLQWRESVLVENATIRLVYRMDVCTGTHVAECHRRQARVRACRSQFGCHYQQR